MRSPGDLWRNNSVRNVVTRRSGHRGQTHVTWAAEMATQASFDITSNVDLQEVDNALNQARKEVAQRYDFKGSKASIEFDTKDSKLLLIADDEFKLNALWEIV